MASGVAIHRGVGLLVELDRVARRVGHEGLAARPHRSRFADDDPLCPQLGHGRVEVRHGEREVLPEWRRGFRLDQVDLAGAEVDPGAAEAEVGPVVAQGPAQHLGVEGHRLRHVGDVDGHVVDGERLHDPSLPRADGPRHDGAPGHDPTA